MNTQKIMLMNEEINYGTGIDYGRLVNAKCDEAWTLRPTGK
jgi:hypothetical protein